MERDVQKRKKPGLAWVPPYERWPRPLGEGAEA
jgi:hypothetical protein